MINRTELREEMKRGLKERDTDARILINEKGVLKDKIQKMEVRFVIKRPSLLDYFFVHPTFITYLMLARSLSPTLRILRVDGKHSYGLCINYGDLCV